MTRRAAFFACVAFFLSAASLAGRSRQSNAAAADTATLLKPGASIERALDASERHAYDIELQAGQYAAVTVEQRGVDVVVDVIDPSGTTVAVFDDEMRTSAPEHVALVADATRVYRLTVSPRYPKHQPGGYAIRIDEHRVATEHDRALYEARRLSKEAAGLRSADKFDEAFARAVRAATLAEQVSGPQDAYVGALVGAVAALHHDKGQEREAEQSYLRAIDISQAALGRDHPQTASWVASLGSLYLWTEDYRKAEPLLQDALARMERTLGDHPQVARCLILVSLLHGNLRDYTRATVELERAHEIAERTMGPNEGTRIAILNNLGALYRTLMDYDRAKRFSEQALRDFERTLGPDSIHVANPLLNLGLIACEQGDCGRGLEYTRRAYDIRAKAYGVEDPDTANVLNNLGDLYHAQKNYAAALDAYQRARDVLERTAGPYSEWTLQTFSNAARTYAAQGDLPHALEYQARYDAGQDKVMAFNLAIGSERGKVAYLEHSSQDMGRTISLHLREAPTNAEAADLGALAILRHKGRALDTVSDSRAALRARLDPADRTLLDELSAVTAQLSKLALNGPGRAPASEYRKNLTVLEEQQESLEARISSRSAEFRADAKAVTLASIQSAVPRGSALVEYAVYQPFNPRLASENEQYGDPHYAVYVIRRDAGTRGLDLGPAKAVDASVAALRAALRDPARHDVATLARSVDEQVLRPVRSLVGNATQLLIAPDGALNLIPFAALVDERGGFQVERYAISYLESGRDLLRMQVPRPAAGSPLVLADPAFGEPSESPARAVGTRASSKPAPPSSVYFAPLAGTAEEAVAIGRLLYGATVLTGERASKAALARAGAPSILHIASHAFFLPDADGKADARLAGTRSMSATVQSSNPLLRSGIALAGANLDRGGHTGILTALEASTLNLWGTQLVTLSACDTGVGDVKNGEGVYGLRRAFSVAGAQTLVMSLWAVSDYTTRTLMTRYYSGLARGEGRGEALRRVQLRMLTDKNRRHPFYWAGFIQAGDWRPIQGLR
jgi:CHAT domain-containing protein/tetratricopeptide (TPR) repeat protein